MRIAVDLRAGDCDQKDMLVGVISDTHGLVRPEALQALQGVELIVHAGDIGGPHVLEGLAAVAPVRAIRGNNDMQPWARELPDELDVDLAGHRVHLVHDLKTLAALDRFDAVICGHSHKPLVEQRGSTLVLNPGSAGPRRFSLPISLARLHVTRKALRAELVSLAPGVGGLGKMR